MPLDALQAARDAVEALPSHLFDRAHTEEIAANLAPDFARFAAQRGAERSLEGYGYQRLFFAIADAVKNTPSKQINISVEAFINSLSSKGAPPQTGGGAALSDNDVRATHLLLDAADFFAATLAKADPRAWKTLMIYAPKETGGGDAGERARELYTDLLALGFGPKHYVAGRPDSEQPPELVKAALEAALRDSGAEAMREACKTECDAAKRDAVPDGDEYENGWKTAITVCKTRIGALPIPGKTDVT